MSLFLNFFSSFVNFISFSRNLSLPSIKILSARLSPRQSRPCYRGHLAPTYPSRCRVYPQRAACSREDHFSITVFDQGVDGGATFSCCSSCQHCSRNVESVAHTRGWEESRHARHQPQDLDKRRSLGEQVECPPLPGRLAAPATKDTSLQRGTREFVSCYEKHLTASFKLWKGVHVSSRWFWGIFLLRYELWWERFNYETQGLRMLLFYTSSV